MPQQPQHAVNTWFARFFWLCRSVPGSVRLVIFHFSRQDHPISPQSLDSSWVMQARA